MSSKKITDADKLEIARLYRQSGDTTASLANRYGVSNSTIGRILKSTIPEAEYESLIQQRRSSKANSDKEIIPSIDPLPIYSELASDTDPTSPVSLPLPAIALDPSVESAPVSITPPTIERDIAPPSSTDSSIDESNDAQSRRVRRRSSAPIGNEKIDIESLPQIVEDRPIVKTPDREPAVERDNIDLATDFAPKTPIPRTPVLRDILADSHDRYANPPVAPVTEIVDSTDESEEDSEPEDVNALAAMFGEEVADNDDEEEEEDSDVEDWAEEPDTSDRILTADGLHLRVKPLSQATLPRTCYIVIDKFAELIVRPLKDFADLGQISGEETQQRTLPVFDNPRVAKRFSNQRTQRVIKVPDSRVFYKTSQHLKSKGIACLLIGGNIYSLN
jgi:hypothetical protein